MKIVAGLLFTLVALFVLVMIYYSYYSVIPMMSAGTHGSIKAYKYPVTKIELERVVDSVLKNSINVKRVISYYYHSYDSINNVTEDSIDSTKGSTKVFDSAYNDGKRYLTIHINLYKDTCQYTFQYTGTDIEWETSKESEISIAYSWDGRSNGGSEGHGDFDGKPELKKKLTDVFESEFLDKVDKQLGKHHTEPE